MPPSHPSCTTRAGQPKARVLVVDDEPAVARGLRLRLRGCELHAVGSVDAGVALLGRGEAFDLVLCDVMMPGRLGTELVRWIEGARPDLLPRVVLMTGGVRDPDTMRRIEASGVPLLAKPFDVDVLWRLLMDRGLALAA
ncbi:MAG: response regulator [Pseudomonadota bacterium]